MKKTPAGRPEFFSYRMLRLVPGRVASGFIAHQAAAPPATLWRRCFFAGRARYDGGRSGCRRRRGLDEGGRRLAHSRSAPRGIGSLGFGCMRRLGVGHGRCGGLRLDRLVPLRHDMVLLRRDWRALLVTIRRIRRNLVLLLNLVTTMIRPPLIAAIFAVAAMPTPAAASTPAPAPSALLALAFALGAPVVA